MRSTGPQAASERAVNIPGILVGSILALVAIQALRGWIDDATDLRVLLELSFIPAPWSEAIGFATGDQIVAAAEAATDDPQAAAARVVLARYLVADGSPRLWSCLTYGLLHGSWTHVLLNCVWLAAFGTPVVNRGGGVRFWIVAVASAIGGVVAQWLSDPLAVQPMIGASAAVSGCMAAASTFIFQRSSSSRLSTWPMQPAESRWAFLANRGALAFLGMWLVANLVFGVIAVPLGIADGAIAWQAHIGGLLVGLVLFPLIDPGPHRQLVPYRDT